MIITNEDDDWCRWKVPRSIDGGDEKTKWRDLPAIEFRVVLLYLTVRIKYLTLRGVPEGDERDEELGLIGGKTNLFESFDFVIFTRYFLIHLALHRSNFRRRDEPNRWFAVDQHSEQEERLCELGVGGERTRPSLMDEFRRFSLFRVSCVSLTVFRRNKASSSFERLSV